MTELTKRQKAFADAFLSSGEEDFKERVRMAAGKAGYVPDGGIRLLRIPAVKQYVAEMQAAAEPDEDEVAGPQEVAAFLTAVMKGDARRDAPPELKDQMKAAEYLAKYHGMFDKDQGDGGAMQPVIFAGEDALEP